MKNVPGFWVFLMCLSGACGGKSITDAGSAENAGGAASSSGGSGALGGGPGSAGSPLGIGGVSFAGSANIGGSSALDAGGNCQDDGQACVLSPADTACVTDADCVIAQVASCGDIPLIGLNQRGTFVCPAPPCVPPGPDFIVYRTQDCQSVTTSDLARVHCVDKRCLTYRGGCSACPK